MVSRRNHRYSRGIAAERISRLRLRGFWRSCPRDAKRLRRGDLPQPFLVPVHEDELPLRKVLSKGLGEEVAVRQRAEAQCDGQRRGEARRWVVELGLHIDPRVERPVGKLPDGQVEVLRGGAI